MIEVNYHISCIVWFKIW